jgi:hypothetical protein
VRTNAPHPPIEIKAKSHIPEIRTKSASLPPITPLFCSKGHFCRRLRDTDHVPVEAVRGRLCPLEQDGYIRHDDPSLMLLRSFYYLKQQLVTSGATCSRLATAPGFQQGRCLPILTAPGHPLPAGR